MIIEGIKYAFNMAHRLEGCSLRVYQPVTGESSKMILKKQKGRLSQPALHFRY